MINGHYNNINFLFQLDYKKKYYIIILIRPLDCTYLWQLFDIKLLLLLSKAYLKKLSNFIIEGQIFVYINKRMFNLFFKKVWEASFTKINIGFV